MGLAELLWDNPLVTKHLRTRLRRAQVVPLVGMVLCAGYAINYMLAKDDVRDGAAFTALAVLQAALLFLAGASQVAAAVGQAKESGILDFHRMSPQSPLGIALGFLLGAPVREYLLFACTLPFMVVLVARGHPSPATFLLVLLALLVAALLYQTAAALAALLVPRARVAAAGVVVAVLLLNLAASGAQGAEAALTAAPTCRQALTTGPVLSPHVPFWGVPLPHAVLAIVHQAPLFLFLLLAVVRRFRREDAPLLSKPQAVLFYLLIAVVVLGDVWRQTREPRVMVYTVLYVLVAAGLGLCLVVTPSAGEVANGERVARRRGQPGPAPWSDRATNRGPLALLSAIALLAAFAAGVAAARGSAPLWPTLAAGLTAAAVLLGFGSARQYVELRFGAAGRPFFLLGLFALWVMPLAFVAQLGARNGPGVAIRQAVGAVSPVLGIAFAAQTGAAQIAPLAGVTALATALLLAGLFGFLARRVEQRIRSATAGS
jgi:hypothetical protein